MRISDDITGVSPSSKLSIGRQGLPAGYLQGAIIGILILWLYGPILADLAREWWMDPNYSHGFLIPLVSVYAVWERRNYLRGCDVSPSAWGLPLIFAGLVLLSLAKIASEMFLMRSSLIIIFMGLALYLRGAATARALLFPIFFLFFMIPIPAIILNSISLPLQRFASALATLCLQGLSIPVFRDGNIIALPHLILEVAEACSGLRFMIPLLALGIIYCYFRQNRGWERWILIASTVPIAILTNALRIAGTGILAHYAGEDVAQGFYHSFSGWIIFLLALAILLAEGAFVALLRGKVSSGGGL